MSKVAADIFVPDGMREDPALARTTHLGVVAHQDDLEFMAFHGIAECFEATDRWFGGVVCTDGAGSATSGPYQALSRDELVRVRMEEQRQAARVGRYAFVAQLGLSSASLPPPPASPLVPALVRLLRRMRPQVIYTHNPADKHETHVRVLVAVLAALGSLPPEHRPQRLLGCEMWRGLDWLPDEEKTLLNTGGKPALAVALNNIFDSQISGGKRYDLAVMGRRRANATLDDPYAADALDEATIALDLTPLIGCAPDDVVDFTLRYAEQFRRDLKNKLLKALSC
jgi:LmbE family N-acetylglucosaminyl deacetylase